MIETVGLGPEFGSQPIGQLTMADNRPTAEPERATPGANHDKRLEDMAKEHFGNAISTADGLA
jgi:hypothetical protein